MQHVQRVDRGHCEVLRQGRPHPGHSAEKEHRHQRRHEHATAAAKGEYTALFDHGDLLLDVAVEIMAEAALETGAKVLCSAEDKIDDFGRYSDPNLKGDWNHRLMPGQNYICHFLVVAAATLRAVGPLRSDYDGAQDHDLVLRLSEILDPVRIVHVTEVICHWRKTPDFTATALSAKSYAVDAGARAVQDHLWRQAWEVNVSLTTEAQKHDLVRVIQVEEPFNYSCLNDIPYSQFDNEFLVFVNNDIFVEQPNWLRLLIDEALADKAVAAVSAELVYPDRTVQHGGVILGLPGVGDHANRGQAIDDPFHMGRSLCAQGFSAVTGALVLCRADAFQKVEGFDEADLPVAFNDVDLCLKLRRAGFKVIYCPDVMAEHHESASRGNDMSDMHLGRFVYEDKVMLTR